MSIRPVLRGAVAVLAVAGVMAGTGCSGDEAQLELASGSDQDDPVVEINAEMRVCQRFGKAPFPDTDGQRYDQSDQCDQLPIPDAEFRIIAQGGEEGRVLWTGQADRDGRVKFGLDYEGKWTVRVTSPWLLHDIVSKGHQVDAGVEYEGFNVFTREVYSLVEEERTGPAGGKIWLKTR